MKWRIPTLTLAAWLLTGCAAVDVLLVGRAPDTDLPEGTAYLAVTTPELYRGARGDERFFLSPHQPVVRSLVIDWFGHRRCITWGPYFFRSCALGDWAHPVVPPGKGERVQAWQCYAGAAKVDGTRTAMLRAGQLGGTSGQQASWFVYTTTPSELRACRARDLAVPTGWEDQGGS